MKPNYNLRIICGLHRSGTTYLGKIISQNSKINVIREPCNPNCGITNINQWYPYIEDNCAAKESETKQLFEDIYQFRREWVRKPPKKLKIAPHLFRLAVGGKEGLNYSGLKLKKFLNALPDTVCWKDPFVTFAVDYLTKTYNAKAVCLIRHPGAFWYSNARLNWPFDINQISSQPILVDRYINDLPQQYWFLASSKTVVSLAILWKLMARVIESWSKKNPSILIIRHEDLCLNPIETTAIICQHFQIDFTEKMKQYIEKTTQNNKVEANNNVAHDFKRNSEDIVNYWRSKISQSDEVMLREIIADDLKKFYSVW